MRVDCCGAPTPLQEMQARRERKLVLEGPDGAGIPTQPAREPVPAAAVADATTPPLSPVAVTALAELTASDADRGVPGRYPAPGPVAPARSLDLSL